MYGVNIVREDVNTLSGLKQHYRQPSGWAPFLACVFVGLGVLSMFHKHIFQQFNQGESRMEGNGNSVSGASMMNHLLEALPDEDFARIKPHLEFVSLPLGKVLYESGDKMSHVYFPTTAIISLVYIMENGGTAEVGIAGNNGLIGMALFMGGETTSSRAIVQSAGDAIRIKQKPLMDEFKRGGVFQDVLLRYMQSMMTQISQTAVCNRLHTVVQQLCRSSADITSLSVGSWS